MPDVVYLLKVSRPRFWVYLLGPYLVGLIAAAVSRDDLLNWNYAVFALYFTIPANLLVYGVNDVCDYETDKLNPKKTDYETLVTPERRTTVLSAIMLLNLPFAAGLITVPIAAINVLAAFLLLSIFYSAKPVRAKAVPFLDSAFNILYIMPGVFAYAFVTGGLPPWQAIAAGGLWTAAMHAFSAIPDIEVDRKAGLATIATTLGRGGTHLFCLIAYVASAILSVRFLGSLGIIFGAVYSLMMAVSSFNRNREGVFSLYRYFPIVNAVVGFCLFWYVAITKFLLCVFFPCDPGNLN
ncbi:MAG: prenyltransferase [Pyrinomonadaceae bacterium]|nr:prenyltransferase [Pyrinomonadaceae bacterium]